MSSMIPSPFEKSGMTLPMTKLSVTSMTLSGYTAIHWFMTQLRNTRCQAMWRLRSNTPATSINGVGLNSFRVQSRICATN